ncbi:MAG: multidrug/spermidine efflux SMR transporter subunit MdtI [Desulfobacterales bacterium]|nr:multidrug/spermidine efflux SMR transporter subunit MdtI [Desulfobacterales bacterium]
MYERDFLPVHLIYLSIAIVLEVGANLLLKFSHGFTVKRYSFSAIACVLVSFTFLSFAVKGIPLAVAYSIWGGFGLIATAILGMTLFGEKMLPGGWVGMIFIIAGVALIKLA